MLSVHIIHTFLTHPFLTPSLWEQDGRTIQDYYLNPTFMQENIWLPGSFEIHWVRQYPTNVALFWIKDL